jgi:hypothetical protein
VYHAERRTPGGASTETGPVDPSVARFPWAQIVFTVNCEQLRAHLVPRASATTDSPTGVRAGRARVAFARHRHPKAPGISGPCLATSAAYDRRTTNDHRHRSERHRRGTGQHPRAQTLGMRRHLSRGNRTIIGCIGHETLLHQAALLRRFLPPACVY